MMSPNGTITGQTSRASKEFSFSKQSRYQSLLSHRVRKAVNLTITPTAMALPYYESTGSIKGDGKKDFYQQHWNGSKWVNGNPDHIKRLIPIYRYPEVQQAIQRQRTSICSQRERSYGRCSVGIRYRCNYHYWREWWLCQLRIVSRGFIRGAVGTKSRSRRTRA